MPDRASRRLKKRSLVRNPLVSSTAVLKSPRWCCLKRCFPKMRTKIMITKMTTTTRMTMMKKRRKVMMPILDFSSNRKTNCS